MDFTKLKERLEAMQYGVRIFANKEEATQYLAETIIGKTVGIGGSVSVAEMGLYPALKARNRVFWHMQLDEGETVMQTRKNAANAQVYISSVNAISEDGELVNIDNTGNRVAACTFGCETVYFIIGANKVAPDLEQAIYRARNVASPMNAKRLGLKTPCAVKGEKCYDCDSTQRICRNLSIFWKKPKGCRYEIILVDETLGY